MHFNGSISHFKIIYRHGFLRTAVCVPEVQLTRPADNARQILGLAAQAAQQGALIALFPELSLSAYSNDDLFHQDALLDRTLAALDELRSSDPALARYLTPFKPEAGLGLAVVAPEDVAAMSALLIERGVDLR